MKIILEEKHSIGDKIYVYIFCKSPIVEKNFAISPLKEKFPFLIGVL